MEPYDWKLEALLKPPDIPVDPITVATSRLKGAVTALELATEHVEDERLLNYYSELAGRLGEKAMQTLDLEPDPEDE